MLKNPRNTTWLFKTAASRSIMKQEQKFRRFFILDFEATCDEGASLTPNEIIEFPCLEVQASDFSVLSSFHQFVKPMIHPQLTSFCTHLTGISQDAVEKVPEFSHVFSEFMKWLQPKYDLSNPDDSIFVTCGTWDLFKMLPTQCELCDITVPPHFNKLINLKTAYYQATGFYPRSLKGIFKETGIKMQGRLHRGIDDCHAILAIMKYLAEKKRYIFEETDRLNIGIEIQKEPAPTESQ